MHLDVARKTLGIFGYKGKGKSTFAKWLAWVYGEKCLYYDTLHEVPKDAPFRAYKPENAQSVAELELVIKALKEMPGPARPKLFIIDEANRFCKPKPHPLPQGIADMNDWCRHPQFDMGVVYMCRRPVQINTDLTELCDYLVIFQLGGINDRKYCEQLREGLGNVVLNLKPYHYALCLEDRQYTIMSPIEPPKGVVGSDTRVNP